MDLLTRKVLRGGRTVELTGREFELLEYLLRHDGQIVSRARELEMRISRSSGVLRPGEKSVKWTTYAG